jgi:O-antigen/teichoic acid export membrane protein
MSGFRFDLLANISGVTWAALVQVVCVPLYIKFLGIEAFGLIGFYLLLQSLLQVLDFGLSPTINREMARFSVEPEKAAEARDLVRTLEIGYWIVGIAIGIGIVIAAPFIASHWIKGGGFPVRTVRQTVAIMGVLAFFQWPISFYQGGLMGAGRQVLFNCLKISQSTLANGGAVLILWVLSRSIIAFFLWQAAVSALQVAFLAILLWKCLPPADRAPRFDFRCARGIWRFAAGMSGITVCALILTQADKAVVSKLFSLRVLGYYTVAGMFGTALTMMISSIFNTVFPRFSALAASDDGTLRNVYHRSTQLMAVLILPSALILAAFSKDILQIWTRNADIARNAGPIASLLVMGTAVNGLMNLPYALQLAYGWTSIGLGIGVFLTVTFVPAIWVLATHYGPLGAASAWLFLNCAYFAIGAPLTHRRLLIGEGWQWLSEIILPLVPVSIISVVGADAIAVSASTSTRICVIIVSFACATGVAAAVSPLIGPDVVNRVLRLRNLC